MTDFSKIDGGGNFILKSFFPRPKVTQTELLGLEHTMGFLCLKILSKRVLGGYHIGVNYDVDVKFFRKRKIYEIDIFFA
jgi:hypothetical protein